MRLWGQHAGNSPVKYLPALLGMPEITWLPDRPPQPVPSAGTALFIWNLWATFLHLNMIVHCLMTVKTADIVITTYE